jgi:four helix bundle protein
VRGLEGKRVRSLENKKIVKKQKIDHFRDLVVYKRAFDAAMIIFELTKKFPVDEKYSLTDQVRRSSRSVCANLAEGWRKRHYSAVFKNKITDSMMEASETQCWLEFAIACNYLEKSAFNYLDDKYEQILSMLNSVELNAEKFCY